MPHACRVEPTFVRCKGQSKTPRGKRVESQQEVPCCVAATVRNHATSAWHSGYLLGAGDAAVGGAVDAAGEGCSVGAGVGVAVAVGVLPCVSSTDRAPCNEGSASTNAISMNAAAAPIVILARRLAVPRGPKAVLERLLENNAPASALPGCRRITTINTIQDRMNRPYKM